MANAKHVAVVWFSLCFMLAEAGATLSAGQIGATASPPDVSETTAGEVIELGPDEGMSNLSGVDPVSPSPRLSLDDTDLPPLEVDTEPSPITPPEAPHAPVETPPASRQVRRAHTLPKLRSIMEAAGYTERQIQFAEALVDQDVIGELVQGRDVPEAAALTQVRTLKLGQSMLTATGRCTAPACA